MKKTRNQKAKEAIEWLKLYSSSSETTEILNQLEKSFGLSVLKGAGSLIAKPFKSVGSKITGKTLDVVKKGKVVGTKKTANIAQKAAYTLKGVFTKKFWALEAGKIKRFFNFFDKAALRDQAFQKRVNFAIKRNGTVSVELLRKMSLAKEGPTYFKIIMDGWMWTDFTIAIAGMIGIMTLLKKCGNNLPGLKNVLPSDEGLDKLDQASKMLEQVKENSEVIIKALDKNPDLTTEELMEQTGLTAEDIKATQFILKEMMKREEEDESYTYS